MSNTLAGVLELDIRIYHIKESYLSLVYKPL